MDRKLKKLLNSLKCPVCQSQIDGTIVFHCAENLDHYILAIKDLVIEEEVVRFWTEDYTIQIIQTKFSTKINLFYTLQTKSTNFFNFDYSCFNFQNINIEQIISKVNLLVTFS